jgi:hypothetical protein
MSLYCSNTLTGTSDLDKIYFKNSGGDIYYQVMKQGANIIGDIVRDCSGNRINRSTLFIQSISVPANAYAYVYKTQNISVLSYSLFGSYYTNNVPDLVGSPIHPYNDEGYIFYYSTNDDLFIKNCNCAVTGTNAEMCGDTFNNSQNIDCVSIVNTTPTSVKESPSEKVKGVIAAWVWIVLAFVGFIIVIGIIFMILVIFGVFKSGDKILDSVINMDDDQTPPMISDTIMVQPPNTIMVQPPNTIMVQPPNTIMVQPPNTTSGPAVFQPSGDPFGSEFS